MGWCLAVAVCVAGTGTHAQQTPVPPATAETGDHAIVFELGGATGRERGERAHHGGTVAVEVTPIEHWLELEFGATAIGSNGRIETSFDGLFKKPWQFGRTFEFMVGVGPEIVRAPGRDAGTSLGVEAVLDFMFWTGKHVGWYVEPGYEIVWRKGVQRPGIAVAAGLLIGK